MKALQSLASALYLFVLFLFFGVSLFLISLFWAEQFRELLAFILIEAPLLFLILGILLFLITLLLTISFASLFCSHYLSFQMSPFPFDIDTKIVAKYLEEDLKRKYPEIEIYIRVYMLKKNKLEIVLTTDYVKELIKKTALKKLEKELGKFLREQFHYCRPFTLTLSTIK